ncbi:MAG: MFS transporter [Anaerolineaceae bacterium]|nr:MFS transporter [Anaerolineaceae bacterium]
MQSLIKKIRNNPSFRSAVYYAVYWSVFGIYTPYMNLELSRRGFSGIEIGTIGSIRSFVIMLLAPVFARIADRRQNRVKMLSQFMGFAGIGVTLFMFPDNFPLLIAATVLMAITMAPLDSLSNSITVRMANHYHLDFGRMTFWGAAAFSSINLIGGLVWQQVGFKWIYPAAGFFYLLVSLIAKTLDEPEAEQSVTEGEAPEEKKTAKIRLKPAILLFFAVYFLFNFAFLNAFSFTAPIFDQRGASEFVIGLVGAIMGLGGMFVRRNSKHFYQKVSIENVLIISIMMGIIPMVVYGLAKNIVVMVIFSVFRGVGWGLFSLSSVKYIDSQSSVQNASTLQSIIIILATSSTILSSPITGMLYDTNVNLIFAISIVAALLSLVLMILVRRMQSNSIEVVEVQQEIITK